MLQENIQITKNYVHEYNEILKLYIKIRQNFDPKEMTKSIEEFENTYCKYKKENSNSLSETQSFYNDMQSEQTINREIVTALLNSLNKGSNTCILSFSKCDNNMLYTNNPKEKINYDITDAYLHDLIEYFFFKTNEYITERNETDAYTYSVRYANFNMLQKNDLLEEYKTAESTQDIKGYTRKEQNYKSCTSTPTKIINKIWKRNVEKKGTHASINELRDFTQTVKAVNFMKIETLKDILNFAVEKKKNIETNNSLLQTLVVIEVIKNKIIISPSLQTPTQKQKHKQQQQQQQQYFSKGNISNNEKNIVSRFYFFNICYNNENNEKSRIEKEAQNNAYFETHHLIKQYLIGDFKNQKISICSSIGKILYELFCDLTTIHLKFMLSELNECEVNENHLLNYLCKKDSKLKEQLYFCIRSIINDLKKIVRNNNALLLKNEKKEYLVKDERYYTMGALLFKNINVDEYTKNKVIQEALNSPEDLNNCLQLLNEKFQNNYAYYKEREAEYQNDILKLIEKQNEIMKNYEEEENRKMNEINEIYEEIDEITKKNEVIKKELQKHEHLNLKYLKIQDNEKTEEIKRIDTFQDALNKEYQSFLKFRSKGVHEYNREGKKKKKSFYEMKNVDDSASKDIEKLNFLKKTYELEYQKNLHEAEKYTEDVLRKACNLKNKFDLIIKKKETLFKFLKSTAKKLNEKTNGLKTDYKNTKELKLIYPIEDNCTNLENIPNVIENRSKIIRTYKTLNEFNELLQELSKNDLNETELSWVHKIHSICKNF